MFPSIFVYFLSVPSCGIVPFYENLFFDIGLRIYAKFYTIEELVALSEMPSTSSYGWTKVLRNVSAIQGTSIHIHRFWLGVDVFDDHELCLVDCIFVVLTCVHKCNGMACMQHAVCMQQGRKGGFKTIWRTSWLPYRKNIASRDPQNPRKPGSMEAGKQGKRKRSNGNNGATEAVAVRHLKQQKQRPYLWHADERGVGGFCLCPAITRRPRHVSPAVCSKIRRPLARRRVGVCASMPLLLHPLPNCYPLLPTLCNSRFYPIIWWSYGIIIIIGQGLDIPDRNKAY